MSINNCRRMVHCESTFFYVWIPCILKLFFVWLIIVLWILVQWIYWFKFKASGSVNPHHEITSWKMRDNTNEFNDQQHKSKGWVFCTSRHPLLNFLLEFTGWAASKFRNISFPFLRLLKNSIKLISFQTFFSHKNLSLGPESEHLYRILASFSQIKT